MPIRVAATGLVHASPELTFACLADYRHHHRPLPEGFLPPAFTALDVEQGGVGSGTRIRMTMRLAGSTRTLVADVSESRPGRQLVETSDLVVTTFTVDPAPEGARVTIDSAFQLGGVANVLMGPLLPRLLAPIYADELRRLDAHAQQQSQSQAGPQA
jgi:hypothetical protein